MFVDLWMVMQFSMATVQHTRAYTPVAEPFGIDASAAAGAGAMMFSTPFPNRRIPTEPLSTHTLLFTVGFSCAQLQEALLKNTTTNLC
jgi:hypothetical protein